MYILFIDIVQYSNNSIRLFLLAGDVSLEDHDAQAGHDTWSDREWQRGCSGRGVQG